MKYSFDMNELVGLVVAELRRRSLEGDFKVIFHVHMTSPVRIEAVAEEVQESKK